MWFTPVPVKKKSDFWVDFTDLSFLDWFFKDFLSVDLSPLKKLRFPTGLQLSFYIRDREKSENNRISDTGRWKRISDS